MHGVSTNSVKALPSMFCLERQSLLYHMAWTQY